MHPSPTRYQRNWWLFSLAEGQTHFSVDIRLPSLTKFVFQSPPYPDLEMLALCSTLIILQGPTLDLIFPNLTDLNLQGSFCEETLLYVLSGSPNLTGLRLDYDWPFSSANVMPLPSPFQLGQVWLSNLRSMFLRCCRGRQDEAFTEMAPFFQRILTT